jgi:hypothetical protein
MIKNLSTIDEYTEKHHIIPRSLGGNDNDTNLVALTAREHFICHMLLIRFVEGIYRKKKMQHALGMFIQNNKKQNRILTSRQYDLARKNISSARIGSVVRSETKDKISKSLKGNIPWNKGLIGVIKHSEESNKKRSETLTGKTFVDRYGEDKAKEVKEKLSEIKRGKPSGMAGKHHSSETKKLMSKNMKGPRGLQTRIDICPCCNEKNVTSRHIKFCKERNK